MDTNDLKGRDFIRLADFTKSEIRNIIEVAFQLKDDYIRSRKVLDMLSGRTIFIIPFDPSLRMRNSFETGMYQLGGNANLLEPSSIRWPILREETVDYHSEYISDMARVLSRMGDALAIRILGDAVNWDQYKALKILHEFANWADIPVINMEDNLYFPTQGIADAMTLIELYGWEMRGRKIAACWTSSPKTTKRMAPHHAFLYSASFWGSDIVFAHPPEMKIDPQIESSIKSNVEANGGSYSVVDNMKDACENADIVYAKNYVCMDLLPPIAAEPKHEEMKKLFAKYQDWIVDEKLMNLTKSDSGYMHCMPCERGFEVADSVLDGKWGKVTFTEAENCLHAQKGVMASIIR